MWNSVDRSVHSFVFGSLSVLSIQTKLGPSDQGLGYENFAILYNGVRGFKTVYVRFFQI